MSGSYCVAAKIHMLHSEKRLLEQKIGDEDVDDLTIHGIKFWISPLILVYLDDLYTLW